MNRNCFQIELNEKNNENDSIICKDYWSITDDFSFEKKVKDISDKFDIKIKDVTQLVKLSSKLIIKCESCEKILSTCLTRNDLDLYSLKKDESILCSDCEADKNKLIEATIVQEKIDSMNMAIDLEKWKDLEKSEIDFLIHIINSTTKKDVIHKIFKGADMLGPHAKENIWPKLNKLNELNLIWIERKENSRIVNYHTNGRLRKIIREEFPEYFNFNLPENEYQFSAFKFSMQESLITSGNKPNYSGYFKVDREIIFEPGREYSYGGWKNDDGSMFIKIVPAELARSIVFNEDEF